MGECEAQHQPEQKPLTAMEGLDKRQPQGQLICPSGSREAVSTDLKNQLAAKVAGFA
jgi:hypothetical protein